jgi:hypothetical protein
MAGDMREWAESRPAVSWRVCVGECVALGRHVDWGLVWVSFAGRDEEVAAAGAPDTPMVVVDQHVMVPTKQDTVGEIGVAVVALPLIEVMRLAPGRRPVTAGEPAPTIPSG